jgi:two-component system, cell cycle sensor histidine kinase and response regulator CckA
MRPERSASGNSAGITIVVVDDDDQMRTLVERVLRTEGYDVHALDGFESARKAMNAIAKVDLLLTDVEMPDGAGSDLVAQVKQTHPATRVVYMSSYSPDELLSYGVNALGTPLLSKPFLPSELLAKVREVLGS